ncbi:MAG TPA: hypothetical protein VGW40_04350 [Allosphingosinicella sp.]|nr:hypothetical protein [Allosphingosinicella sp.]
MGRSRLIAVALGAFLLGALTVCLVLLIRGGGGSETGNAAQPTPRQVAAPPAVMPAVKALPSAGQLAAAFAAAFGRPDSARIDGDDHSYRYRPERLIWMGERAVLISLGTNVEDFHAASGTMAVHYLAPEGTGFRVTGAWPEIGGGGTFGAAPHHVAVNRSLSPYPVISGEGGGTWQGYTCSWAYLIELGPDRPIESGPIPLSYTNAGAVLPETGRTMGGDLERTVEGRIGNIRRGRGFDVIFTGTERFIEHYDYRGNRFARNTPESRAVC